MDLTGSHLLNILHPFDLKTRWTNADNYEGTVREQVSGHKPKYSSYKCHKMNVILFTSGLCMHILNVLKGCRGKLSTH